MTYENGLVVALLLWLFNAIMIVVSVNSQMNRNLNKIGQRLSWVTFRSKTMERYDLRRPWWKSLLKYLLIVGFNLVFTLASWLYVAGAVVMYIYAKSKDSGAPEAIRAYRWKLKNIDMSFDDMIREAMKLSEKNPEEFEQFRKDMRAAMDDQMDR
jgi:hypothetical protein